MTLRDAMSLADVSITAVFTLLCRATQAEQKKPGIDDPMAVLCLDKMISSASVEDKSRLLKWKKLMAGMGAGDAKQIVSRVREIDRIVNDYISKHASCTIVNLACGFDTRFWRIESARFKYIELDLPELIALKKQLLGADLGYEQIGCSVLDTTWIDKVTSDGNSNFLLIAEGLFMYLPKADAERLLRIIAQRFVRSQFVLDMGHEKVTRGLWRKMVDWKYRFFFGTSSPYEFGIKDPRDMETYGSGFKVIDVKRYGAGIGFLITASMNESAQ